MKKILLAALMLLSVSFVGCKELDIDDIANRIEDGVEEAIENARMDTGYNIKETVLYDNKGIVIKAAGITYDEYEVILEVSYENNTKHDLCFDAGTLGYSANAVNGYMVDDGWTTCDVSAGETETDEIEFGIDELNLLGINAIADIQIGYRITDENYKEIITGPLKVKTPLAKKYNYKKASFADAVSGKFMQKAYGYKVLKKSEQKIAVAEDVSIISEIYLENESEDRSLMLEVKNESDEDIYFVLEDATIDGESVYGGTCSYDQITAGCKRIVYIPVSDLADEPEDVEKVGFGVRIKDSDEKVVDSKTVIINVK